MRPAVRQMEENKPFVDRCAPDERPYGCDYRPFAAVDGGVTWSVLALSCRVTVALCSDILPLSCCFFGGVSGGSNRGFYCVRC